jgi:hypothetical protein
VCVCRPICKVCHIPAGGRWFSRYSDIHQYHNCEYLISNSQIEKKRENDEKSLICYCLPIAIIYVNDHTFKIIAYLF